MAETLDLSSAKTGAFDNPKRGWHNVHIERIESIEIDNDEGKLPMGTPGYNVSFVIDDGEDEGKWAFNRFWLPKADSGYDEGKRSTALGRFVDFLVAAGYAKDDVMTSKYKFDEDDLLNRQLSILTGINKDGYTDVRNFRPIGGDLEEQGIL